MEYDYTCVFCHSKLARYEVIIAEFPTLFESDMTIAGFVVRAPSKRISCTFPIYACHHCIVERSGILDEDTKLTT